MGDLNSFMFLRVFVYFVKKHKKLDFHSKTTRRKGMKSNKTMKIEEKRKFCFRHFKKEGMEKLKSYGIIYLAVTI
jgi:hypothetical protein